MLDIVNEYTGAVVALLEKIAETQKEKIEKAAEIFAETMAKDKLVHVIGTGGHSMMPVEEVLCRHEGLVTFNPIYDPGISLSHGAVKAIFGLEGVPGYGRAILEYNRIKPGDVMLITSAYGANLVTIEIATEAKKMGAYTIAITSPRFSQSVPKDQHYRHPSNKNLYEVVDMYIDSHVPPEHVVKIHGLKGGNNNMVVGTICQVFVINLLVGCTIKKLLEMGVKPKRWVNMLEEGGIDPNIQNIRDYVYRVKCL
jgi:uncharacterized phosphosugar-binding protein